MKKWMGIFVVLAVLILIGESVYGDVDLVSKSNTVKARVIEVENTVEAGAEKQYLTARVTAGPYRGQEVVLQRYITKYSSNDFRLMKDSEIYISLHIDDNQRVSASLAYVSRERSITLLALCFFIVLLLFGMLKGVSSAISLLFTAFMIIKVYIPWVVAGKDPVSGVILVAVIIIVVSFIMISGFTKKTLVAVAGTTAGTLAAGIMAAYFSKIGYITGVGSEDTRFLITELGVQINFKGLLFSGIVLGAIGAVMDVSMSISSLLHEIRERHRKISSGDLVISGLRVGRDIMATMVNTLILAYVGTSLSMFVLFSFMETNTANIINSEMIATEIIRSLCGSIGLILTVPFTSLMGAFVYK
ncbi:MAG: YibE/F family protein [Firmicutes bacterium]|nr:YibE/F family protein [Bacillota bacterium]